MNRIEQTRQQLLRQGKKIINLSSGNPSEHGILYNQKILTKSFQKIVKNPAYHPDPKGNLAPRKAVQSYYKDRGFFIDPEQIILTSGTSESYFHLFKLLAKPGEKILFPNPAYPLFEEIARLADIELSFYQLNEKQGWQIDSNNLESKITKSTRAIVLISPGNPTGAVFHRETLRKVIAIAQKYHLPIISDEVFCEFMFDAKKFPRIAGLSRAIDVFTLNGISKTYALPGFKLSWIVATGPHQKEHIETIERSADAFLSCNQIAQSALPDIMKHGQNFLHSFQKHVENNRDLTIQMLRPYPHITFHEPEGGFYLFAHIKNLKDKNGYSLTDEEFVIQLMKKTNIFVHPGYFYDYDSGVYILISYLMPPKKLRNFLRRLLSFLLKDC